MPRPASNSNLVPLTAMVPKDIVDRLNRQIEARSTNGAHVTRSDIVRAALAHGLGALEKVPRPR